MLRKVLESKFEEEASPLVATPLVIVQFNQRVVEAEHLVVEYEAVGAADQVNQMELAYQIFSDDLSRLNSLLRESDILREDHIVSILGHYLLKQYAEKTDKSQETSPTPASPPQPPALPRSASPKPAPSMADASPKRNPAMTLP